MGTNRPIEAEVPEEEVNTEVGEVEVVEAASAAAAVAVEDVVVEILWGNLALD